VVPLQYHQFARQVYEERIQEATSRNHGRSATRLPRVAGLSAQSSFRAWMLARVPPRFVLWLAARCRPENVVTGRGRSGLGLHW
jgi:hypothetical protein